MRGKPNVGGAAEGWPRNIPAYAGKTKGENLSKGQEAEHPRVCGENANAGLTGSFTGGTSPRMRGKL